MSVPMHSSSAAARCSPAGACHRMPARYAYLFSLNWVRCKPPAPAAGPGRIAVGVPVSLPTGAQISALSPGLGGIYRDRVLGRAGDLPYLPAVRDSFSDRLAHGVVTKDLQYTPPDHTKASRPLQPGRQRCAEEID
jgi:hypothetical protein